MEGQPRIDLFAFICRVTAYCKRKGIYADVRRMIRVHMLTVIYDYCDPQRDCPRENKCLLCAWHAHVNPDTWAPRFRALYAFVEHNGIKAAKQWWYRPTSYRPLIYHTAFSAYRK
jgi:hypothetical protein